MIYTEEEAKKRWCRHRMTPCYYSKSVAHINSSIESKCIASECMAWRWSGQSKSYGFCGAEQRRIDEKTKKIK